MNRILLAGAAALFGGAAVIAAVLALLGNDGPQAGADVIVNPPGPVDAHSSPTLARNPTDSDNLVLVNRIDRPTFRGQLHASFDGGATWATTELPLPDGTEMPRPYAPDAGFDQDGTLYVTYVNLVGAGNRPEKLWMVRSTDGGRTLSEPTVILEEPPYQARLAVAPDGARHVTWARPSDIAALSFPGTVAIMAARAARDQDRLSEPVPVSDPSVRPRVGAATPQVTPGGDVVVLYQDFKDDQRDFQALEGPAFDGEFGLVLARSADGGESFSEGVEFESGVQTTERFLAFLPPFPSLAVADDDTLYAAWEDGRTGDRDVLLRRSDDGGETWSEPPVRVNDNPPDGTDQYLPRVDVAPDGRIDVLFYDRRNDPNNVFTDVYLASSGDGGRTFANTRVTDTTFDSRVGPFAAPFLPPDYGTRLGLVNSADGAIGAWTDARLGNEASARQDIAVARIRFGGSGTAARTGLVGVLVLLAVGSLAGWRVLTRRERAART